MSPSPETATSDTPVEAPPQSRPQSDASPAAPPAPGGRHRVLAVDDEKSVLTSLRRLLRREPYELELAESAEEALELLEQRPATVVLSDQRMPGMTGIEMLREVRRKWPDTVRLILSGYSAVQTIIDAINEGEIYKFMSKPWNDEELKGNIRGAIDRYELVAENRRMASEIAEQNERLKELNAVLDQRANDATAGLTSFQDLHDSIAVGVLTFDDTGLIVGVNQLAGEMIASDLELFGMPARDALPDPVYEAFFGGGDSRNAAAGRLEFSGKSLQWRLRQVGTSESVRGKVATLWETVS